MKEREQLADLLLKKFRGLSPSEQEFEKDQIVAMLFQAGALSGNPPLNPLEEFLNAVVRSNVELDFLLNPQSLNRVKESDSPSDLISRLLPSDSE